MHTPDAAFGLELIEVTADGRLRDAKGATEFLKAGGPSRCDDGTDPLPALRC
jgi:hypothetical protein